MKKYLIGVMLLLAIVATPVSAKASTIEELQAVIAQLTAQLAAMSNNNCVVFNQDLSIGDGEPGDGLAPEVRKLQRFLIDKNYLKATATGYFGKMTRDALVKFQQDNDPAHSGAFDGITQATGVLDGPTRTRIKELTCGSITPGEVVIINISGPTELLSTHVGTWKVHVAASSNSVLTYSVDWGDNRAGESNTTGVFTHTYEYGTYTATFKVTSQNSIRCIKAPCPTGDSEEAKLIINVGSVMQRNGAPTVSMSNKNIRIVKDGEPKLMAVFYTAVSNNTGYPIYVPKSNPWETTLVQTSGRQSPTSRCDYASIIVSPELPRTVTDEKGVVYVVINPGETKGYEVTVSCPVNYLFAGSYYGRISNLAYRTPNITDLPGNVLGLDFETSSTYVVGEQGPYITSVGYEVYGESGYNYKITGERFTGSSIVYLNGEKVDSIYRSDGTIRFNTNRPMSGVYPVYVVNSTTGKSNTVNLTIGGNTDNSVSLISPNGGERVVAGQSYTIRWNTNGYPSNEPVHLTIGDQRYSTETGPYPELSIVRTTNSGSYTWRVPTSMANVNYDTTTPNHKIKIYLGDGGTPSVNADESDRPFYLLDSEGSVIINSISGPTSLCAGQTGTWKVNATAPINAVPSYTASWNDGSLATIQSSNVFSHKYSRDGVYKLTFNVLDKISKQSVTATISVSVACGDPVEIVTPVVLSPNGGQTIDVTNPGQITFTPSGTVLHYINLSDITIGKAYSLGEVTGQSTTRQVFNIPVSVISGYALNLNNRFKIQICSDKGCDMSDGYITVVKTSAPAHPVYTCTDSDGGQNPYVKGYTVGYDMRGTKTTDYDTISTNPYGDGYNYAVEWFCPAPSADGSVYRTNTNIKCLYGSANGVCSRQSTATTYNITTTVNGYGSISPSGVVAVNQGDSKTFNFTPRTGYKVGYVAVDNQYVGTPSSYTLSNVQANRALRVTFQPVATTTTSLLGDTYSQMANSLSAISQMLKFLK